MVGSNLFGFLGYGHPPDGQYVHISTPVVPRKVDSLDLPIEAEQAEEEPESFPRPHPAPIIVDELQYAPGLFRYLSMQSMSVEAITGGSF